MTTLSINEWTFFAPAGLIQSTSLLGRGCTGFSLTELILLHALTHWSSLPSQPSSRYGQDAEAMLSQPATKLFFKTTEPRAAQWISDAIGEIEVERLKESRSTEVLGSKKSFAMEIATKPLVMASEISGLEPLHGFIKQENRVVPVHFQFAGKHRAQAEFIERKLPDIAAKPSLPAPVTTARTDQPNTPAAAQNMLPLSEPTTDKATGKPKEMFVWDESKGIE